MIPEVGEKWFKQGEIEAHFYEPYIKPRYRSERKGYFPFSYLLERYAPMMKIIMKYFSCEGRFSRVYSYHIRLLMHFTRVKMLSIPYYIFMSVEKVAYIPQRREYKDQMKILFHHSIIKIIVLYHLKELNIAWSTFIANPIFTQVSTQNVQDIPSSSHPPTSIPPTQLMHYSSHPPSPPLSNNVNFETGTINSKRELWPKNPEKTSKTVLKVKTVDVGITPFLFLGKFSTCFKNGGENQFFA